MKHAATRPTLVLSALLAALVVGSALAGPKGGGGSGGTGGTQQVCAWVQVPIFVVTGYDRYGFPIGHMELQNRYVCHTVRT